MSLYNKGAPTTDKTPSTGGKVTTLNPNAIEFVPFALRSSPGSTSAADASSKFSIAGNAPLGKTVLGRSESSVSNSSDEEAHQYWRCQLPDDITPDFNTMGEDDTLGINSLPFSNLSFTDVNETSRFPASTGSGLILKDQQELSHYRINGGSFLEKIGFSVTSYGEDPSSAGYHNSHTKLWDRQIMNNDHLFNSAREDTPYNGNSGQGFLNDMLNEQQMLESTDVNPLDFLASQFPGFAAESVAEVYFANGGDLNLTIEMLTQLELQVDGGLNQNLNSKALSSPNLSALDFPALSVADGHNGMPKFSGDEIQQNVSPYQAYEKENLRFFKSRSSIPSRGPIDFASAVRKMASQDSGIWKYDRNGSPDASVGSSRSSHVLASSYNGGQGRQGRNSARAAPVWVETGEAVGNILEASNLILFTFYCGRIPSAYRYICFNFVEIAANIYSETREDARDHARLRNAYFEQARQAYLIGNKALAKELSVKGQLHNMQMKAAHAKAQEFIYRHRNPLSAEMQGNGRGQERLIDLHGLHASEAIHVLKRDLTLLRSAARSVEQRLQVYICVGTGHHTRGSHTSARLPIAVQRYLLEEEGLDFSEPQPGLLCVVIY